MSETEPLWYEDETDHWEDDVPGHWWADWPEVENDHQFEAATLPEPPEKPPLNR